MFYDAGNVFEEDWGDIGEENGDDILRQNYGFGFRWFSPIGVLRFEFGYPINDEGGTAIPLRHRTIILRGYLYVKEFIITTLVLTFSFGATAASF
jgi:outer membrane protein assembly factor BamA